MRQLNIFMLFAIIVTTFACKKEKQPAEEHPIDVLPVDVSRYSNLKVGNYWIYREFAFDSAGIQTPTNVYDSCYIEKDTIIRGNTYFKLMTPLVTGPSTWPTCLRDSADCIVDSHGIIQLSCSNFSTPIHIYYYEQKSDTLLKGVTQMTDQDVTITVPAGVFSTINAKHTYYIYPLIKGIIRYRNTRYAKDVGIVQETSNFYLSVPTYIERKLVRYHLN